MMGVMMLACLPTELSNFLTIRPLNSQIYRLVITPVVASLCVPTAPAPAPGYVDTEDTPYV